MVAQANGTVTVTANATDNVGVTGVQFQLDGTNLGGAVTGAGPTYSYSWDTTADANGAHTLAADCQRCGRQYGHEQRFGDSKQCDCARR